MLEITLLAKDRQGVGGLQAKATQSTGDKLRLPGICQGVDLRFREVFRVLRFWAMWLLVAVLRPVPATHDNAVFHD